MLNNANNSTLSTLLSRRALALILLFGSLSFISGCSTPTIKSNAQQRSYQEQIQFSGRLSIYYQEKGENKLHSADYEWSQQNQEIKITFLTQLGQTVALITQTPQMASLEQSKQATRYAANLEELMNENFGWSLPVTGLKDWLQGFIVNSQGSKMALESKNYLQLENQSWQLNYVSWQEKAGKVLPKRLDLERETEQFGNLKLVIFIDELN
jgi:outer membrane lipoprotein LolB